MSLNLLLHALAYAGVVLLVGAITRGRGCTLVAAVAAALLALAWGHAADVAEKWVIIGVGYWACWRMLPRQKFPRSARPRKTSHSKIRHPTFTGLKGGLLTAAMVVVVSVVAGLTSVRQRQTDPVDVCSLATEAPWRHCEKTRISAAFACAPRPTRTDISRAFWFS